MLFEDVFSQKKKKKKRFEIMHAHFYLCLYLTFTQKINLLAYKGTGVNPLAFSPVKGLTGFNQFIPINQSSSMYDEIESNKDRDKWKIENGLDAPTSFLTTMVNRLNKIENGLDAPTPFLLPV